MGKFKVSISMSLDGYVAGPDQSEQNPLGIGGERLHDWFVPLRAFREGHGEEGGEVNASTPIAEEVLGNVGAVIMGRNMFGGGPGPWGDDPWKGWWGDNPPYHCSVFVLTHHAREPQEMQGGTTYYFVTDRDREGARAGPGGRGRQGRVCRRRCERGAAVSGGGSAGRDRRLDRPRCFSEAAHGCSTTWATPIPGEPGAPSPGSSKSRRSRRPESRTSDTRARKGASRRRIRRRSGRARRSSSTRPRRGPEPARPSARR